MSQRHRNTADRGGRAGGLAEARRIVVDLGKKPIQTPLSG